MTRFLLLTLALMCENVNAAPQVSDKPIAGRETSKDELAGYEQPRVLDSPAPVGAAPFKLS